MDNYRAVTLDEFRAFLTTRPQLQHSCTTICEPPLHGYYDWSKATSKIGTSEAADEAMQAYFIAGASWGGKDEYFVRREGK